MLNLRLVFGVLLAFFLLSCNSDKKDDDSQVQIQNSQSSEPVLSASATRNLSLKFQNKEDLFISINDSVLEFDNKQKATLFVFFTTWCAPCNALIPHLNNLQEKYKDNFQIFGILLEKKGDVKLDEFMQRYKINYDIAIGESNFDLATVVGGVNALPLMMLYGSDAKLMNTYLGLIPQEMLDIDIQKAIN